MVNLKINKREKFKHFISIIMPVYNSARTLETSLKAIYNSNYNNFELIVVDDGSTDNSIKIAEKFPCRIIKKKQNTGAGDSRNIGAKSAKGEILIFIDSDCIVKPNTILQITESFKKGADVVAGTYSKTSGNNKNIYDNYHSLFCYYNYTNSSVALFGTFCAAIKKNLFIELGGFDDSIKGATVEDLKFQYKIQDMNIKYDINMDAQVFHYSRDSFISLIKGYYYRTKNGIKLLLKMKKTRPSKEGYILNYRTIISYLSLIGFLFFQILVFFNIYFIFPSILSLIIYLVSRSKFYKLAEKKQLLKIILIGIICDIVVLFGVVVGLLSYILNKGKRTYNL